MREQASNDENCNVTMLINVYKEHLNQIGKNNWLYKIWDDRHNALNGKMLRLYRCFKNDIFAETYVTIMMPFAHGRYLAML